MYSMPAFWQASISAGRIGREASLMSVSPRQNFWKPPPVPGDPDRDPDVRVGLLELLGDGFADREDRAGAVDAE